MHSRRTSASITRETGRAPLFLALLLAAGILTAALVAAFFAFDRGGQEPIARPGPAAELPPPPEEGAAPDPVAAEAAQPAAAPATEAPAETGTASPGVEGGLRIFGHVTDDKEKPLPGIHLRWLPLKKEDLRLHSHDGALLGRHADPPPPLEALDPALRAALAASLSSTSDAAGSYEHRVPPGQPGGVIVACGPGYEIATVLVDEKNIVTAGDGSQAREIRIDCRLGPGGTISGTITDKLTGEPVPGMAVLAGTIPRDQPALYSMIKDDAPSTIAHEDGTYRIEGLPPAEYHVVPRTGRSDYPPLPSSQARKVALGEAADVDGVDFQVRPGGRISGVVTGPGGGSVEGAQLNVKPANVMEASMRGDVESLALVAGKNVIADVGGRFEIRGLPLPKRYRVTAKGEELAPSRSEPIELTEEKPEAEIQLTLSMGSSISGRVLFKDGRPAPAEKVNIVPKFGDLLSGEFDVSVGGRDTTSDAAGAFRLENLAAGQYLLHAGKLTPQTVLFDQQKSTQVAVDGKADVTGVQVFVEGDAEPSAEVAGVVVDDRGSPVEGASVKISSAGDFAGTSATVVVTGGDGRFSARIEGSPLRLSASKTSHSSADLRNVDAGTRDLTIILARHGRISGKVLGPEGLPPGRGGNVRVNAMKKDQGGIDLRTLFTGGRKEDATAKIEEDGSFSIESPPVDVQAIAIVPGFAPGRSGTITVPPGGERSGVEIRLSVGATLRGQVMLGGGAGVAGATLSIKPVASEGPADYAELLAEMMPQMFGKSGSSAVTNEEGHYEIRNLAEGAYTISATHPDFAPSDAVTVPLRENEVWKAVPLVLSAGARIAGRVVAQGKPKGGMMVQLMGGAPGQTMTGADGLFQFKGLKPGEYLIQVLDLAAMQGGKMTGKTKVVVIEGSETIDVEVGFGSGHKVLGTIQGLPPAPIRMVMLRRPGGPDPETLDPLDPKAAVATGKYQSGLGMIASDGKYEIDDIEPGEYIFEIPRMPADPTDLESYRTMDRKPHYRKDIKVEKKDLELDIDIR